MRLRPIGRNPPANSSQVKSFWLGWGSVCVAGAGAYYFAKREINADRQAKLEAHRQKRYDNRAMEYGIPNSSAGAAKPDYAGSPSAESNNDPAPGGQDLGIESKPKREKEDISPYESKVGYRSRKGERFS
ncbi:hypothetical protein PWT90_11168 [Aphanocladium album]|nr:hypothetical protein PWT90_11168 [Aphanocladium album]